VVEAPDGNRYSWLPVRGGQATFELALEGDWAPRLPVHFLLLRGVAGTKPVPGNATDPGGRRPSAPLRLEVEPVDNRVVVGSSISSVPDRRRRSGRDPLADRLARRSPVK
jgi:hypothetical protein